MKKIIILFLILCAALTEKEMCAQEGGWVAYSLTGFGPGAAYHDCDDGCIGYTRANARYVLIFDIKIGEWMLADMGKARNFKYLQTEGDVLLAWSDDLLFGYSSASGDWDTIRYEGTLLCDNSQQLRRSYGCSDSLAFFVTNRKFYVFDGSLGHWQQYDYGLPADFSSGYFYPKDDCIILVLIKTDFYAGVMNVVYSSHTHTFNKLENGCTVSQLGLDHGYAGIFAKTGNGKEYLLVGYSAFDNQFDVIPYSTSENEYSVTFFESGTLKADKIVAFSIGFRKIVTPNELIRVKFYGYSTLRGEWSAVTYDTDWEAEKYYGNGLAGGQFTVDHSTEPNPQKFHFFFYSALDGLFNKIPTNLIYTSTTSSFKVGGSVYCVYDAQHAWGYNPVTGLGKFTDLVNDMTAYFSASEDFITFCRWNQAADIMRMYFYNSRTDRWSWIDTKKHTDAIENMTENLYYYKASPENNIIVYSSIQDSIKQCDLPDNIYFSIKANGKIVCASSDQQSVLFNVEKCTIQEKNFEFNLTGIGTESAAFFDAAGKTLHGYSALSDQWTTLAIQEEPYNCIDPGFIGLISVWVGMNSYGKYYAYNSFSDSWVELTPEGTHVSNRVGDKTALVIRTNHLYAFNPYGGTTGLKTVSDSRLKSGFMLKQNYPNPFNGSTKIDYELSGPSRIVLKIFNTQGQELRTLVNENQTAGIWSVTWDGRDVNNQPAGSGIYFYQLQAGATVQSRKMMLMKSGIH